MNEDSMNTHHHSISIFIALLITQNNVQAYKHRSISAHIKCISVIRHFERY